MIKSALLLTSSFAAATLAAVDATSLNAAAAVDLSKYTPLHLLLSSPAAIAVFYTSLRLLYMSVSPFTIQYVD